MVTKITLTGAAISSPLIQQSGKVERATFSIAVTVKEETAHFPVICEGEHLVSRVRNGVTVGTRVSVEVTGTYDQLIVSSMLIMAQ